MITPSTHGELSKLNWTTLSDERAGAVEPNKEIRRAALIMTGACNFACPYCKTLGGDRAPTLDRDETLTLLDHMIGKGLKDLRLSGGEPTIVSWLPELVERATKAGVSVAISSNGYAPWSVYQALIDAGMSECSISLDTLDPEEADRLAGGRKDVLSRVTNTIKTLADKGVRVYIGMTCCESSSTAIGMKDTVAKADALGATDIKIMPPVQEGDLLNTEWLTERMAKRFPFLAWRSHNFALGCGVRGMKESDCSKCALALDDVTVAGGKHYPCNVYFREGGEAIGKVGEDMLAQRAAWYEGHNSLEDPICKNMCMDLLRTYNNRVREMYMEQSNFARNRVRKMTGAHTVILTQREAEETICAIAILRGQDPSALLKGAQEAISKELNPKKRNKYGVK